MPSAQSIRLANRQAIADLTRMLATLHAIPVADRAKYRDQLNRILATYDGEVPEFVRKRPGETTVSSLARRAAAAVLGLHGPALPYRVAL